MVSHHGAKGFKLNHDPDTNKNNIYMRKLNQNVSEDKTRNPLNRILQPTDISKSRRFVKDKLNISDIEGAQPDVYKRLRNYEGREYINVDDIKGAKPKETKARQGPDYKFLTRDVTNPSEKFKSKRIVDPLSP
jgi:hypothetical protein